MNGDPGDFQNFMAFGNMAFEDHRWPFARKCFLLAHEEEPENADAVYKVAMTDLLDDKDLGRARWMAEQVLPAANPQDAPRLLDTLARIALRQGRYADAKSALDQAQSAAPGEDPELPDLLRDSDDSLAQAPAP
jgi:tetratricopeptide (TPR) repeat protein